jgi:hypothetical protein
MVGIQNPSETEPPAEVSHFFKSEIYMFKILFYFILLISLFSYIYIAPRRTCALTLSCARRSAHFWMSVMWWCYAVCALFSTLQPALLLILQVPLPLPPISSLNIPCYSPQPPPPKKRTVTSSPPPRHHQEILVGYLPSPLYDQGWKTGCFLAAWTLRPSSLRPQ